MITETDQEQIEMLKRYWREYGRHVLIAILVGVGIGYGWQYWQKIQLQKNQEAAMLYHQYTLLAVSHQDPTKQATILKDLESQYPQSAYASFANLVAAMDSIEQNNPDEALQKLKWVKAHTKDENLADLAAVREARILLAQHQPQQSLELLKSMQNSIYQPMVHSLEGDAYTQLGQGDSARKAYEAARQSYQALGMEDPMDQLKLSSSH